MCAICIGCTRQSLCATRIEFEMYIFFPTIIIIIIIASR